MAKQTRNTLVIHHNSNRGKSLWTILSIVVISLFFLSSYLVAGPRYPSKATVHNKYYGLIQTIYCPRDEHKYGHFRDYGYWRGGNWCGKHGRRGYWVWVSPSWYVWSHKRH